MRTAKIGPDVKLLKVGPDTNSQKFVLTAARYWPQRWLTVRTMSQDLLESTEDEKRLFLARLFSRMICRQRREGSSLLSFLLFYGLMVGKYALLSAMEIQKIQMVVLIFSGFALFTELMWVYRRVVVSKPRNGVTRNSVTRNNRN